jgi:hypothetical protein
MKKIIAVIFLAGLILICAFLTPVVVNDYYDNKPTYVGHSNVFSSYNIVTGRFFVYLVLWTCFTIAIFFVAAKSEKKPAN